MEKEKEQLKKEFDEKFVRDDGLIDKYYYDEDGDTVTAAGVIKDFMTKKVEEAYRKGVEDGGADENNRWQRELLFLNKETK